MKNLNFQVQDDGTTIVTHPSSGFRESFTDAGSKDVAMGRLKNRLNALNQIKESIPTEIAFKAWPKTPRLSDNKTLVSEKLDGSNCAIIILEDGSVGCQARNGLIYDSRSHFGFKEWVDGNKQSLFEDLGPGYHFGELIGGDIQRGYGLDKKHREFYLFNAKRWTGAHLKFKTPHLKVVPILGEFEGFPSPEQLEELKRDLIINGSKAVPGFMFPEGMIAHIREHEVSFKIVFKGDLQKQRKDLIKELALK